MTRSRWLILAVAVILILLGGIYYSLNRGQAVQPELTSFTVEKPNFVAEGRGLIKVEIWAIPTGTGIGPGDYEKLGDATNTGSKDGLQVWTLPIPPEPVLATQIYAKGYGDDGREAGQMFLPYTGATSIYDAIWGESASTSTADIFPPPGCGGCVGERDNGRTITVGETSRITIGLPAAEYKKNGLTITPPLLGETFGAGSAPGYWVRTFEAVQPGTAVLKVPGVSSSTAPWTLTVNITGPQ